MAKVKVFKVKEGRYYKDRQARLYGPMKHNKSAFGERGDYFTCPGHPDLAWRLNGQRFTTVVRFFGAANINSSNGFDLIERISPKTLKKKSK
ncbi:hypothetical protein [Rhizobium phage RHph_N46]|nr:hypothetical protein EVC12_167 [Rhizobium phage RHph_I42]QXV73854.1 hypothetical protein [Rhizobium phage RHph_N46]